MNKTSLQHSPLVVALTGGIGSGKTAVSETLASLGVQVIDTDVIARNVVEPGSDALHAITSHFGDTLLMPDGSLDRHTLRKKVFSQPHDREWLEALLHPLIRQETLRQIAQASDQPYILVVVPLLGTGSQWQQLADRILVIDVPESLQLSRVSHRDNTDEATVAAIIRTQPSREERLAMADDVIENTGTLDQLRKKTEALHEYYTRLARND